MTLQKIFPTHPKSLLRLAHFFKSVLLLLLLVPAVWGTPKQIRVCDDIAPPMTLDPHKQFSEKNHTLLQQIYEGLVRFDPEGKIIPLLATSWKQIDPLTMEFHLRHNVYFHNGELFDASSVKFSIDRYLDPKTEFPAAGFISSLKAVEVLDPYTIRLKTHFPDGILLNRLAGFVLIVPRDYCLKNGADNLSQVPVGTGPFSFKGWVRGKDAIELEANALYWDSARPKISKLIFCFIPAEDQLGALFRGDIDILTNLRGTKTIAVQKNEATTVLKKPTYYTVSCNFNTSRSPLSNKRVRQAMNLAINKSDLIRYDLMGNGVPIAGMSMPGQFGHNDKVPVYTFDLPQAQRIFMEEGYRNGFTLNVLVKADGLRTTKIIANHLSHLKIKMNLTVISDAELIGSLKDENKKKWDMVIGDCPDPTYHSYFIPAVFFYSKSPFALSINPEFDTKLEHMVMELDLNRQLELAEDLDSYIHEEALGLFCYQQVRTYGIRKGIRFSPATSGMDFFDQATSEE